MATTKNPWLRATRLCFGLLALSAVITEIVVTMAEGSFRFFNFFGFFTILSNLAASALLIYLASVPSVSHKTQHVRGAVTLYMFMTGVIFAMLLAGLQDARLTAVPWDNIVLHYILPVAVVADWFLFPPKTKISLRTTALWLIFPVVYVTYTLIRGSFVGWYPYPFLNPTLSSYPQVLSSCLLVTIFVVVAAWIIRARAK